MASLVGSVAENDNTNTPAPVAQESNGLVTWVMSRVNPWRDHRDQTYARLWGEYYRLWRGRHTEIDKTRSNERSKIVTTALSQALDMTVSELDEATFGRDNWIDIIDDSGDPDHSDIGGIRFKFLEDLAADGVPDAISACYLNGGLWGTLAAKVVVERSTKTVFNDDTPDGTGQTVRTSKQEPAVKVKVVPISVRDLIADPDGDNIDDMLGIAHEVAKPRAWLLSQGKKFRQYAAMNAGDPGAVEDSLMQFDEEDLKAVDKKAVLVTEWHGKVPKKLLPAQVDNRPNVDPDDPLAGAVVGVTGTKMSFGSLDGDGEMVEAIVTILDKKFVARAIENPFIMKDRSIVACQFERVPGQFHGRGVMEKGYNPQKALDAEVRTRMDVMALVSNPMMAADQTALPRGFDMRVRPGKVWLTNGEPGKALAPMQFPGLDPASFSQSGEMERMVQMGTGAMDTATPLSGNRRNETATGASLISSTFVKRSKRSLRHITNNFLNPIIQKILWRRMEFDPVNYPADFQFRVVSTLGIVARELENQQMTMMLQDVADKPQTKGVIIQALMDNSATPYKEALTKALEADSAPDPAQQQIQQMQVDAARLDLQNKQVTNFKLITETKKLEAEVLKTMAQVEVELQKPGVERAKLQAQFQRLEIELGELQEFSRQNDITAFKNAFELIGQGVDREQSNSDRQDTANSRTES